MDPRLLKGFDFDMHKWDDCDMQPPQSELSIAPSEPIKEESSPAIDQAFEDAKLFQQQRNEAARRVSEIPVKETVPRSSNTFLKGTGIALAATTVIGAPIVINEATPRTIASETVQLDQGGTVIGVVDEATHDLALQNKIDPAAIPDIVSKAQDAGKQSLVFHQETTNQPGELYKVDLQKNGFGVPSINVQPVDSADLQIK